MQFSSEPLTTDSTSREFVASSSSFDEDECGEPEKKEAKASWQSITAQGRCRCRHFRLTRQKPCPDNEASMANQNLNGDNHSCVRWPFEHSNDPEDGGDHLIALCP